MWKSTASKSALPAETDELITQIIGCAIRVHSELGPGFLESIYSSALALEFGHSEIAFQREKSVVVLYRGETIAVQRVDFVVDVQVILEIKSVARVEQVFRAKLLSYMRAAKIRAGLLINFNVSLLKDGIERFVL
ncbi:MAG TPA: GxxExxY protein [Vicinamibacterales bacterium]|nr:GxxExxY protein [Vicinamibacterales bacterium]